MRQQSTATFLIYLTLALLLAVALWLRWQFIAAVQLYPDEFVTLLAIDRIGQTGLPLMPSGLFYEHGLLYSYLAALAAQFGPLREAARLVSLLCGAATFLLIFRVGRGWFSPAAGLLAAAGLAIAPAAIEWSGRARMYALLQLLALLTLWLAYTGITHKKRGRVWLALLAYLGATLAHFGAVALAPPLLLAVVALLWLGDDSPSPRLRRLLAYWPEAVALALILATAFVVKRAGQPKGIDELQATAAGTLTGIGQVLQIYSDLSFNPLAGWQAIAPFYLSLPALIFALFGLLALGLAAKKSGRWPIPRGPVLFLGFILAATTLEMILFVSPDRRDDKYLFMLLPALLLLGAAGLGWLLERSTPRREAATAAVAVILAVLIVAAGWPAAQRLLANTGDDYDAAFAFVREQWQPGDAIFTGTPAAAMYYLGRNDFYGVQRRGGYDYRLLTVAGRPVDRWLASPAVRTEADLHRVLAEDHVWLVLERWGLQREYYDLPFQQQLLAQTEPVFEAQGMFVLRAKPNPQPIAPEPRQPASANFANQIELLGYTVEPGQGAPGQPLRITLYWRALAPPPADYTVFVHLRQPGGGNVAQADHRPLGNIFPTSLWPVGETIRETSELALPPDLPPGDYELWAGLYRLDTLERLPVQADSSGENAVRLGQIAVR